MAHLSWQSGGRESCYPLEKRDTRSVGKNTLQENRKNRQYFILVISLTEYILAKGENIKHLSKMQ